MNDDSSRYFPANQAHETRDGEHGQRRTSGQGERAGQPAPAGNRRRPLTDSEMNELCRAAERVPGLGHIMLSLVRNRAARVVVPETPLGGELMQIVAEFDRLSFRAGSLLTRQLSAEKMQIKAEIDLKAVGMIEPLARLTASLANQFDNPQHRIARHGRVRHLQNELRREAGEVQGPVTEEGGGQVESASGNRPQKPRRQRDAQPRGDGGTAPQVAAPASAQQGSDGGAPGAVPGSGELPAGGGDGAPVERTGLPPAAVVAEEAIA